MPALARRARGAPRTRSAALQSQGGSRSARLARPCAAPPTANPMRTLDPQSLTQHVDRLYRAAWALCGSREDAEDLVQETFARVLARPRVLSGDDELYYLMRVLRNTFFTSRRTASRRPVTVATLDDVVAADPRPLGQPERALEMQELYATIAALPEDRRLALVAVDVLGLSYREAARALRVREATITTRLFRARKQLAQLLDPTPGGARFRPGLRSPHRLPLDAARLPSARRGCRRRPPAGGKRPGRAESYQVEEPHDRTAATHTHRIGAGRARALERRARAGVAAPAGARRWWPTHPGPRASAARASLRGARRPSPAGLASRAGCSARCDRGRVAIAVGLSGLGGGGSSTLSMQPGGRADPARGNAARAARRAARTPPSSPPPSTA